MRHESEQVAQAGFGVFFDARQQDIQSRRLEHGEQAVQRLQVPVDVVAVLGAGGQHLAGLGGRAIHDGEGLLDRLGVGSLAQFNVFSQLLAQIFEGSAIVVEVRRHERRGGGPCTSWWTVAVTPAGA